MGERFRQCVCGLPAGHSPLETIEGNRVFCSPEAFTAWRDRLELDAPGDTGSVE